MSKWRRARAAAVLFSALSWTAAECLAQQAPTTVTPPTPALQNVKFSEACELTVDKGLFCIDANVDANSRITDYDGSVKLDFSRDDSHHVDNYDLTVSPRVSDEEVIDEISYQGGQMSLSRREDGGGEERSITIRQGFNFNNRGPGFRPPIQMMVDAQMNRGNRFGGGGFGGFGGFGGRRGGLGNTPSANSFDDLIKAYPQETEQFIRPMLRDLRCEDLLPPANLEFIQVLADDMAPNPGKVAMITSLVKQLDADAAEDRDAASATLKGMQGDAIVALLILDRSNLSPEQSQRVDAIVGDHKLLTADEIKSRRLDVKFLLTALASNEVAVRNAALKVLSQVESKSIEFDTGGNPVVRSRALTNLHDELLPKIGN